MSSEKFIKIDEVTKSYSTGLKALRGVNLEINKGEILALLGPNGAGKTTLINAICGIVLPTSGQITVDGYDVIKDYRKTRSLIGLVPQELQLEAFEQVFQNVSYTRGLYGKSKNPAYIEKILKDLSLWDKKDSRLRELSGGMKRRALIAKALSHEPKILFLDEPTAGVDINLRRDMWRVVKQLQESGVTIILTTHYIAEPKTTKYKDVDITGESILWIIVLLILSISCKYIALAPIQFMSFPLIVVQKYFLKKFEKILSLLISNLFV